MSVVTRFAPSPTGFLHIGGARTALFNWLYARNMGGKFFLRIEDTDRQRSTQEAVDAIFSGLNWLGLDWDGDVVYQFSRAERHREVVDELLKSGNAYYCYCTQEELSKMREDAKAKGLPQKYNGYWRDRSPSLAPNGVKPVVRLRANNVGKTSLQDLVQGDVVVDNSQLDDMVLLRGDGTPTYMLSVVVDDHDMGITNVIRGDDHLTNTFRQIQIYQALGWDVPKFAHIPLINAPDGTKMSKRHGAVGVGAYKEMGFLPEAMQNYLLRLGWGHGDDEIISKKQAIAWFNLDGVGKSPSRFDMTKLLNLNAHYLREAEDERLILDLSEFLSDDLKTKISQSLYKKRVLKGMKGLKQRAKNLKELAENMAFYLYDQSVPVNAKASEVLNSQDNKIILKNISKVLLGFDKDWTEENLHELVKNFSDNAENGLTLGKLAQVLRAALTGSNVSPSIFEVMDALGKEATIMRLEYYC